MTTCPLTVVTMMTARKAFPALTIAATVRKVNGVNLGLLPKLPTTAKKKKELEEHLVTLIVN